MILESNTINNFLLNTLFSNRECICDYQNSKSYFSFFGHCNGDVFKHHSSTTVSRNIALRKCALAVIKLSFTV